MSDTTGVGPEIEPFSPSVVVLESFDLICDLFLGQPDQRTAQQCAQGQRVTAIGNRTRNGDEVLDFLPTEKALAGLRGDRNFVRFEFALVNPQAGAGGCEERDVAGARRTKFPPTAIPHGIGADESLHDTCDGLCFLLAYQIDRQTSGVPMLVAQNHFKGGNARPGTLAPNRR